MAWYPAIAIPGTYPWQTRCGSSACWFRSCRAQSSSTRSSQSGRNSYSHQEWTLQCMYAYACEGGTLSGMTASTTMLFPRPRIQLIAAGFLSVHMFPEIATSTYIRSGYVSPPARLGSVSAITMSGNSASSTSMAFKQPLLTYANRRSLNQQHLQRVRRFDLSSPCSCPSHLQTCS